MDSTINLTIIVLLLAANGFFVAAEFGLVKAKGVRISALALQGKGNAILTERIQKNLEAYLAACQLGITMASLGLGWVGEPFVAGLLAPAFASLHWSEEVIHPVSFIIGFMIFSSLHIVVGEQVPKTLAIRKPEPVALWIAYPLHAFFIMTYPFNRSLGRTTTFILNRLGVQAATHEEVFSGDEIHSLIEASETHGEIESDRAGMLKSLLSIDKSMVCDVMVPSVSVDALDITDTPEHILEKIRKTQHSRFPLIGEDGDVIGVLLIKDLIADLIANHPINMAMIQKHMRQVSFVPELMMASDLFDEMRASHQHMTIVIDEYGDFTGLVTMEDLLEEIVGEIADEHDEFVSEFPIEEEEDGAWLAHGLVALSQVEKVTGFCASEPVDASTLSGLFMQRKATLPQEGDVIEENGYRLSITRIHNKRADLVRIEVIEGA